MATKLPSYIKEISPGKFWCCMNSCSAGYNIDPKTHRHDTKEQKESDLVDLAVSYMNTLGIDEEDALDMARNEMMESE